MPTDEVVKSDPPTAQGIEAERDALTKRLEEAQKLAEEVAKEVGGQFWETHRLNTGLLIFMKRWAALKGEKR